MRGLRHAIALVLAAVALATGAPAGSHTSTPTTSAAATLASSTPSVAPASDDPNASLWGPFSNLQPQPLRGKLGASMLGPHNIPLELQNSDLLAPPSTDQGSVPNAKWPFALSHNRLQTGGWARQQTENDMPISTAFAGVNMRLEAGAIRELHWHTVAEWAYVITGDIQITAVDTQGRNYVATLHAGDLWYMPSGIPHSLQAMNTTTNGPSSGSEFLLLFPSGTFSEDSTFLLTDWLAHVPKEVIAKNFNTDISAFNNIPSKELYIFPAQAPAQDQKAVASLNGQVPMPYSFSASTMPVKKVPGGTIKMVDSTVFNISKQVAFAEVTIEPGHMRELHWHPTQPEWNIFLNGTGRITLYAASSTATTFDFQAGDIGYIPASYGHYIENTGNTTLKYLEMLNTDVYQDVSLSQWLALTPPQLVKDHLGVSDDTISHFQKEKQYVV